MVWWGTYSHPHQRSSCWLIWNRGTQIWLPLWVTVSTSKSPYPARPPRRTQSTLSWCPAHSSSCWAHRCWIPGATNLINVYHHPLYIYNYNNIISNLLQTQFKVLSHLLDESLSVDVLTLFHTLGYIFINHHYLFVLKTHIAKSFVMKPSSTVLMTAASKAWQKCSSSLFSSKNALWRRPIIYILFARIPLVHANIDAIELVEVSFPYWCYLKCLVTVPWAASASTHPSVLVRTLVINPNEP